MRLTRSIPCACISLLVFVVTAGSSLSADNELVMAAINKPGRLAADVERDLRSKPEVVIPLLNLGIGDRVIDIFGSGGYYSELLAGVVGTEGEVLLHNNAGFEAWGVNELTDRFNQRDPGSITRYTRDGIELELEDESLDAAIIVMALHDMYVIPKRYNGQEYVAVGEPADVDYLLQQVYQALRPGGRFVVVDHAGAEKSSNEEVAELHRINESFTRNEVESAGFRFVDSSDALRNPQDDRTMIVFDLDVQGKTDQFVLAFEKPASP